ncbi:DUF4199 domain-containing protein [uncultured Bacteroides sp.]|uniref:DUF4199 domain-containing protein n=1 Tax=uncultured Bacteroides sp. TaxID=162156 RepID=UPI002604DBC4|nr:DUF4199 domain-containing protein [uncultured Bacteroides sp.]
MADNRGYMQRYAMLLGTYMGVFWIMKFAFFPLGLNTPFLFLLFLGLTLCVPFMGYYYVKMFRDRICGGSISFLRAWAFTVLVYLFAAMLTAIAHYIYFRFIDQGFIISTYQTMLANVRASDLPGVETYLEQLSEAIDLMGALTPTDITIQLLSQNVFYGSLLAIPTALFVMRRRNEGVAGQTESKE